VRVLGRLRFREKETTEVIENALLAESIPFTRFLIPKFLYRGTSKSEVRID